MKRFQRLSNDFELHIQGPLVFPKQSTSHIAVGYSGADHAFVTKTNALAVTYPLCRIMGRDSNSGWRAVAFGYFEGLLNLHNLVHAQAEVVRIKSLNTLLDQVGHREQLYEIFSDATEGVFFQVCEAIQGDIWDDSFLRDAFSNQFISNAIIVYFRFLTSAWIKLNPLRYQDSITHPVDQYCAAQLETVWSEIDEVGLQALVDGIIGPSGTNVEILYLDRCLIDITSCVLTPSRRSAATIRLLYRPGQYDILYQLESTVKREHVPDYQYGMTAKCSLCGKGPSNSMSISTIITDPFFGLCASRAPATSIPCRVLPLQKGHPPLIRMTPSPTPVASPSPPRMSAPSSMASLPAPSSDGLQIRLNPWVIKLNPNHFHSMVNPSKKGLENAAHFQHQNFEPIHWSFQESHK